MEAAFTDLCLSLFKAVTPDEVWRLWSFAPPVIVPLVVLAAVFWRGMVLSSQVGTGRRTLLFVAGWMAFAIALVSPLCRLSASLAWAHMLQHILLVAVAPPLLLLGCAGPELRTGLPGRLRHLVDSTSKWMGEIVTDSSILVASCVGYGLLIWVWHLPAFYDLTLANGWIHVLAYGGLIAMSLLFWSVVLVNSSADRGPVGAGGLALFATAVHTGFLGAMLTLSSAPWFAAASGGPLWGLSLLEDQQLAGLIMWVPMSAIYLGATLGLFSSGMARLLARDE